jgi:hypothetical protein
LEQSTELLLIQNFNQTDNDEAFLLLKFGLDGSSTNY